VDRLLGEHGLQQDTAAAWQEFERRRELICGHDPFLPKG